MQLGPSSEKSSEGSAEQPSISSPWSTEERKSVVAKLHNLELINKRLTEEKSHLQRQLNHVLRRLASERFVRHSGGLDDVSKLLRELAQSAAFERPSSSPERAPLASAESMSMMESNGRVSITEYSSLSDTFDEIVLEKDPVQKMSLELSSPEEGQQKVEIQGEEFITPTPAAAPPYHSPSISQVSEDRVDWGFHIPSLSPALSYSTESIASTEATPPSHPHESSKVGAYSTPHTPVLIHRPKFSFSLPPSPHKYTSRHAIIRGIEEARRSAFKWLETTVQGPVEMESKPIFGTPPSPRRTESIVGRAKRKVCMPHSLRRALIRSSHKPRVKVGSSDDFLNDFFTSSEALQNEGLHAAIIFSRYTEVARELDGLFSHLHAYTSVRRHCFAIQCIPAQQLRQNLNYFYQARQNNVDRLFRDETSSEEARSTAGIPLSNLTPEIIQLPPQSPIPSANQYRSSPTSTEYNVPPTDDSTNNADLEILELHQKLSHYAGRLSKLSSRFKLWQSFWCVLADKSLLFYTGESEVDKWPKKCIDLADVQRVERLREPRTDGRLKLVKSSAFNLVMENGRIYTLRSTTPIENHLWENKIRLTLRRVQAQRIAQMYEAQLVTSGWLRMYRRGQSHRVWGMLMGTFLVYSRDSRGQTLIGYRDLSTTYIRCPAVFEDVSVETDTDVASSQLAYDDCDIAESGSGLDKNGVYNFTIALWSSNRDPVYFVYSNSDEYERWKQNLLRACWFSSLNADATTLSIQPESRFLHLWGQLVRPYYSLHRTHSENVLKEPISRIIDSSLEVEAIRLSKKLLALSNLHDRRSLEESEHRPSTSYRLPVDANKYNLIKEIAQMCFDNSGLKDELFLQLIKQATPSALTLPTEARHFGTEPTKRRGARVVDLLCHRDGAEHRRAHSSYRQQQSQSSQRFRSPPGYFYKWIPIIVMWECLAIYSTLFLPSPPVLACLQAYLTQFAVRIETGQEEQTPSPRVRRRKSLEVRRLYSEISRFAAFCTDMIMRCRIRGGRTVVTSCFEVVAISLRNPYTHSLPFSLPIHFSLPSGYEVVSFDGTMKVAQLMGSFLSKLELSEAVAQGLCHCGLYCRISGPQYAFGRTPARPKLIYLENTWSICDVISLYESKLIRTDQSSELNLEDMTIDLVFRITAVSKKAVVQASPFTNRIMDIIAHQLHSDLYSGELSIILRGTHLLELTALMCRCDYVDYAELQRRQEVTLTQIMDRYFPQYCLATWGCDDQALIELKLLLLERWNKVCRETSDPETNAESNEFRFPKPAFAYTMYFWRLHPAGACIRQFPCNLVNFSEVPPDETIWIAPSFEIISLLRICTFDNALAHPIYPNENEGGVTGMACFKRIPLGRIISFGVQQTGAFFIVFSKVSKTHHSRNKSERTRRYSGQSGSTTSAMSSTTATHPKLRKRSTLTRKKTPITEHDDQLDKLLFFIRDLCEINELCNVLNFTLENFL
nr:Pleckstrin y [Hymenolepis microstoma]